MPASTNLHIEFEIAAGGALVAVAVIRAQHEHVAERRMNQQAALIGLAGRDERRDLRQHIAVGIPCRRGSNSR